MLSTWPLYSLPVASTAMVTRWPGRMLPSWVSLKFAVTQMSSRGMTLSSSCPELNVLSNLDRAIAHHAVDRAR